MLTDALPRISLADLPTPLEELPRLREALGGGPRLWIKRDDQTGLATGGNKARKLEFLVAEALEQGADTLVTVGAAQSNHCRQTAAAAAKVGLRCVLVLSGEPPSGTWNGNLLLSVLLGAELRWAPWDRSPSEVDLAAEGQAVVSQLRAEGARPFFFGTGGSVPTGAAGYVAAVEELHEQLQARDLQVNRIVFASGSAGTQAGILVGVKALQMGARVEGMAVSPREGLLAEIQDLAPATAELLGLDLEFARRDYILNPSYGARGYAVITDAEREAIRLLARTEGILVDPVYTGRALAGLIDMVRGGVYRKNESVLFWHTGGVAGLFARADEVQ
jgi:L-cysteate sulfo-lyase